MIVRGVYRDWETVHIRTKTDTGRWGEYPKALGGTVVKELGKMAP